MEIINSTHNINHNINCNINFDVILNYIYNRTLERKLCKINYSCKSIHTSIMLPSGNKNKKSALNFIKLGNVGENYFKHNHCTIHSEISCLNKLNYKYSEKRNQRYKRKMELIVIRTSPLENKVGNSKICKHCLKSLSSTTNGIKITKIHYTTENGTFLKTTLTKLNNDKNQFISSGNRKHIWT